MNSIELNQIVKAAIKMATEATDTSAVFNNKPDVVGPVAAVLVTGALNNNDIKAALLDWKPTM